ncbi:MAG: hypothetical protein R2749_12055 [Acidimicrobiales bacterium]
MWHKRDHRGDEQHGIGFAPVRPGTEDELVQLMESVEDIPGTALHEGLPWGWETFGEYLDTIDTPYTAVDIGAQVPHVALRHYVMGERCYDDATPDDMVKMAEITRQALADGALGFSTSRFYGHLDKAGNLVPGTNATSDEMVAIAEAFTGFDHGTMEIISDHLDKAEELGWIEHIARITGRPLTMLVPAAGAVQGIWDLADKLNPEGFQIRPQVGARPRLGADDPRGHAQPDAAVPRLRRDQAPALRRAAGHAARSGVPGEGRGRRGEDLPASPTPTR